MSIWATQFTAGPAGVRSYANGWSNHYPTEDVEHPALVSTAHIPTWCVPGHDDTDADWPTTGPWLRLDVATWDDQYGRPMIPDGASIILDPAAARALAADLTAWADAEHIEPREEHP